MISSERNPLFKAFTDQVCIEKDICGASQIFIGMLREVMIAYEEQGETVLIITVHPLKKGQKENRISTGRWVKL